MIERYRRSGADPPFGDPCGSHGTALEGYFWRITEPRSKSVVIVMASVNRDRAGTQWGTAALAAHPGVPVRTTLADGAIGVTRGIGVTIADRGRVLLRASASTLEVDLDEDTRLRAQISAAVPWRRRALGGIGVGHVVPGLSQYWHPHLLGGHVAGTAVIGGRAIELDGASVYAEKNWSPSGFPTEWWWGQAQAFSDPDVCVAFAGGHVGRGRVAVKATAVVARIGEEIIAAAQPLQPIRIAVTDGRWSLLARTARHTITLEGEANGSDPHALPIPLAADRRQLPAAASQHLAARVQLTVRRGRRVCFSGVSELAGLERGAGTSS